jgi:hypothetical protein
MGVNAHVPPGSGTKKAFTSVLDSIHWVGRLRINDQSYRADAMGQALFSSGRRLFTRSMADSWPLLRQVLSSMYGMRADGTLY